MNGAADWWKLVIKQTFADSSRQPLSQTIVDHIYHAFTTLEPYALYEDSKLLIDSLKSMSVPIGLISNTDPTVKQIVGLLGWSAMTEHCSVSYETNYEKPAKEAFDVARGSLKVEDCWHVGDDAVKDFHGCIDAGWNGVLIDRTGENDHIKRKIEEQESGLVYKDETTIISQNPSKQWMVYTTDLKSIIPT